MASVDRRRFLQLAGVSLAGMGLAGLGEERAEALPEGVLAFGAYLVPGPDGEEVGRWAEIVGAKGYKYIVKTEKGIAEVPLANLKLLHGWPFPVAPLPKLGWRNDAHWLMEWVPRLGGSMVRINAPPHLVGQKSDVTMALELAKAYGLKPVVVFNPLELFNEEWLREKARYLFKNCPQLIMEIGNEPDNPVFELWKGRDFGTYARLVHVVADEAVRNGFTGPIVVGALVDVANQPRLIAALKKEGVNLGQVDWGVHIYQSVGAVNSKMATLRWHLNKAGITNAKIWVTELGVNYNDKHGLMPMVEAAWRNKAEAVLVHEAPIWKSYDGVWGFVDPFIETATPMIFDLASWTRKWGKTLKLG